MALRDTLLERSKPFLEEGEQPRRAIPVQTGLSPYLLLIGILFWPMLLIVLFSWRHRIVVATDRATLLLEAGKFSPNKPKGLLQRVPPNALHGEVDGVLYGKVELAGERYRVHRRFFADVRAAEGREPDSGVPASPLPLTPPPLSPPPAAPPPAAAPPLQADAPADLAGLRVECEGRTQMFAPGAVVTIGRDDDATIPCPHPAVSRSHAVLRSEGGVWTLRDSGSRNGTYVDGSRVTTVEIQGPTVVLLGHAQHGGRVDLALVAAPPPPPGPGAAVAPSADQRPADASQPEVVPSQEPLRVRCAGHDYEFPPGASFTIGRDQSCDVHADNPLVSRVHAKVSTADAGWVLEDAGSSRGVFWDGRKVTTQRLGGAMTVWLGPEDSGQEVLLVTSGDVPRSLPERIAAGASRGKFVVAALGAAGVALVVALVVALGGGGGGGGGGEQADLPRLRKATVQIAAYTRDGGDLARAWTGSGTVVSSDGLILTNAHVAAPTAPGQGVDQGSPVGDEKPAELRVLVNEGDDRPAKEKYVAKVVAADGYLDLAVLRIVSTVDGTAVNASDLDLEKVDLGDSNDVTSGDEVTVLGYPGVAESGGVNVTRGVIGSRVPDKHHRVKGQPLQINIDAQIHGGNSGDWLPTATAASSESRPSSTPRFVRGRSSARSTGSAR